MILVTGGPGDDPPLDTARLTPDTAFAPTFDIATAVADHVAWRASNPAERLWSGAWDP